MSKDIEASIAAFDFINSGFEIYVVLKGDSKVLSRFIIDEGNPNKPDTNKKLHLKKSILDTIKNKYISSLPYDDISNIADDQNKLYCIKQTSNYQPLSFLNDSNISKHNFSVAQSNNVDAFVFRFKSQTGPPNEIWCYQKVYPLAIPNRQNKLLQYILSTSSPLNGDIFTELKEQVLMISKNIDLLIINNTIVTDNIKLLERSFAFEDWVRARSKQIVELIKKKNLILNIEKIGKYIERSNKKYARKLLQINNFNVINLDRNELILAIKNSQSWKNKFIIENDNIKIKTYNDVTNIIDFFIDRYTLSETTKDIYDTSVKTIKKNNK